MSIQGIDPKKVIPEATQKDIDNFLRDWEDGTIIFDLEREKKEKINYNFLIRKPNGKEKTMRLPLSECLASAITHYQYAARYEQPIRTRAEHEMIFEAALTLSMYLNWTRRANLIKPSDGLLHKLRDIIEENTHLKFRAETAEAKAQELQRNFDACRKALNGEKLSVEERERLK